MSTKIVTTAKIEECKIKQSGASLKFSDLKLTSSQIEQIADLVGDEELISITIETVQGNLLDSAKKGKP